MNSIAILKTGRYTDANGRAYDITPAVLEDIARNTPPNSAPLVKGHPSSEAPSMGWVQSLKVAGDKLLAVFGKLDPAFAEEVKAEAFRNVSASFFQPYAPSNPKQGHYVLRHVGALGAARPAIPGLGTLQEALAFAEDTNGITALSENIPTEDRTLLDRLAGFFHPDLSALKEQIRQELLIEFSDTMSRISHAPGTAQHAIADAGIVIPAKEQKNQKEASMPDDQRVKELEAQLEASKSELAKEREERTRLAKEAETAQNKAAVSAEVEKLGETKQIAPELKQGLVDKALALVGAGHHGPAEAVAAFGEYLPNKQAPRKNWGSREEGKGLSNFNEQDDPAFSEDFALKKAAHEKAGLSPEAAYDAAMRETQKK